ncbi:hydrogen gas-evolving membrane-bound hydrogenase subunit E [Dethiothermospora halolimnae]|uniref:hydrogen gas-evolving membrane-bound hydrogenase subunit E n=1 Tax=Dethiothermospora halolimnae TaxID=3114390 RepID=UPI003CCB944F
MIKKILLIFILIVLITVFINIGFNATENVDTSSKDYYINNTYSDTGSKNIVTGIYLDYRLFDSIFEASILIIVVSGIIFISKRDDDIL